MKCRVCGHDGLGEAEYRTGTVRAPALECKRCHAIQLDEGIATSAEERDSVRRAVAARMNAMHSDSGTYRTDSGALSASIVDSTVSQVDVVLAEIRVALEFCSQMTDGELGKAVADAQGGIQRIETIMADLGRQCEEANRREADRRTAEGDRATGDQVKL